ncbi:ABC transporter substrate-binding protein, partial [Enterococcus faecium]|uniref:ABC transporter substrate-binding protein n=1 Tax=Enterococcus faecium TaxID=1352 RepID=UPI003F43BED9
QAPLCSSSCYDHVYMLVEAMQKAGTVTDVAKIRKALSEMTYDGLWKIKYDQTGEAVFGFDVVHVRKGGAIEVVKFDPTK